MGDLGAPKRRDDAEEERMLISSYMQKEFTPEQLLADFKVESNVRIKEGAVPCRYSYGKNAGKFSCPGADQDCFGIEGEGTKVDHCEIYRGIRQHGGKLGYYRYLIEELGEKGVNVSEFERILQEVRDYLSIKDLERVSAGLIDLHGRIFLEKGRLEKELSKTPVLSS